MEDKKEQINNKDNKERGKGRIRARIYGTEEKPRLSIFKSNKTIYAQIIDDKNGKTLCQSDSKKVIGKNLSEKSVAVGKDIASKAKLMKIVKVVFDRGGFMYTGNVKSLADAAREGGLLF